jgi:hypothetical protein
MSADHVPLFKNEIAKGRPFGRPFLLSANTVDDDSDRDESSHIHLGILGETGSCWGHGKDCQRRNFGS